MAAPWTQAYIQAKIDFYGAAAEKAATSQEYQYDQGPAGQFGVKKGKLEEIEAAIDMWVARMEKYYPDAYTVEPSITITELGFISG